MSEKLKIKIRYVDDEVKRLEKIDIGDWIDVYSNENVCLNKGESYLLNLGFAMELPNGYEAHLAPRSSTFKTWGIIVTNSFGIIDESYKGNNDIWRLPIFCLTTDVKACGGFLNGEPFVSIKKGDKIAQFRIIEKMPEIEFEEVEHLGNSDRGGLGSTGTV